MRAVVTTSFSVETFPSKIREKRTNQEMTILLRDHGSCNMTQGVGNAMSRRVGSVNKRQWRGGEGGRGAE